MHLLYPIKAILMYFAILFAPADATKITLQGLSGSERVELVREGGSWQAGGHSVSVEGGTLVAMGPEGKEPLKIGEFVALPGEHDWKKEPAFTLSEGTTLERTAAGLTVRRSASGGEANGVYQVVYGRPVAEHEAQEELTVIAAPVAQGEIMVNVFGEVRTPGAYKIPAGGSILDALAAAGGWTKQANLKKVSVIRGPAGEIPKVMVIDANAALGGQAVAPALMPRDSILVSERFL